jgi:uncharacterized paraquat-inducible protein A
MRGAAVACTRCQAPVHGDYLNVGHFLACPSCEAMIRVRVFPALTRPTVPSVATPILVEGESSCFYHPQKRAVVACESCGRFLCGLCDIELGDKHQCPSCLSTAGRTTKVALEKKRTLYDGIALALAIYPILLWPLTLLTAPASLYITIRHWRTPLSIFPRTKIRFVLAFLLAGAQVFGWCFLAYRIYVNAGVHRLK